MANLNRLMFLLLFILSSPAFAIVFGNGVGEVTLSGFTKLPDGTHARAFPNLNIELTTPPKDITVRSAAVVPTSKGVFDMEISKTATVDTARIGSKVASFAKKVGPLGMALAAADLVCELTTICNEAGSWMFTPETNSYEPNSYPASNGQWLAWGSRFVATPEAGCRDSERIQVNVGVGFTYDHMEQVTSDNYKCYARRISDGSVFYASNTSKLAGCAPGYTLQGANCVKDGVVSQPATDSDWSDKQSLLNDDRFIPHLIDAVQDLPTVGLPSTPLGQTRIIDQKSVPVRDSSGNVTGRDDSETVIEAVDAATAEAPGKVVIKETTITKRYDNSNTLISTSETTNYTAQTQDTQPQSFEIKFDEVAPAELQTYSVPNTFESTSWGGGSCPDDVTVSVAGHTFAIPSQPVCDTAVMINPFVLLISTLIGVYIISGVRSGSAT